MNLTKEKQGEYVVLKIEGRVDTTNFGVFQNEVENLITEEQKHIVFDCADLSYISSSGLRVFLIAQKKTTALNGKLHLCNLQPTIKEIFDISGFSTIFKVYDTCEQAVSV